MIGLDRGSSFSESLTFLGNEIRYFVRQGHVHRLPELLAYEFYALGGVPGGAAE